MLPNFAARTTNRTRTVGVVTKNLSADVVVVGGGIVGVATATLAAEAGLSVVLCERENLAAGASGRNQGLVIGPQPPEMAAISARGLTHYEELHDASGGAFVFDRQSHGCLMVRNDTAGALRGEALRTAEPLLGPTIASATLNDDARRIDPSGAVAAWAERGRRAGAALLTGCDVKELLRQGSRVVGVATDQGRITAGTVVVAAGPWSWRVCRSLPFDVPVRGARGWIVVTRPAPFRLRHAIEDVGWDQAKDGLVAPTVGDFANGYRPPPVLAGLLQQDHQGRLLLGASLQISPAEHPEGDDALRLVCGRAAELIPASVGLEVAEIRTCRRPLSADGLPLHGPAPGSDGVVLACGHGSKGITWGPGSAEAIVAGLVSGWWDPALSPSRFDPSRFDVVAGASAAVS